MKEKLELKHLAPYLPYGLQAYGASDIWNITGLNQTKLTIKNAVHAQLLLIDDFSVDYDVILRPLSDLTKEIEVDGEKFVPIYKLADCDYYDRSLRDCIANYQHLKNKLFWDGKLFEWHFDVFGLIPSGLAIDVNTLS